MELWQIWLVAGILLLILEMFTPTFFLVSISIGAIIAGILAFLGFNLIIQGIVFAVCSILTIAFIRPLLQDIFRSKETSEDTGIGKYIGQKGTVVETISASENTGRVKVFGEEWSAVSVSGNDIQAGEFVIVQKVEDLTLFVEIQ